MSRTSRTTRRFLRAISRLLPKESRADWIDEWIAEIATAQEGGHADGTLGELPLLFGAWSDALATRRLSRGLARVRGQTSKPVEGTGRREANGSMMMGEMMRDLGHAVRSLSRAPGFTVVTAGTLALAVGTNAGIFTVVDTVLLDPLPFEDAERLVTIQGSAPGSELPEEFWLGVEFYLQYRESPLFESMGTYGLITSSLRVCDQME